ncbi:MAG TPA: c-type cytochrome [Vicinamibacterales bacterium]|nr:c-type cytochrome [Vicinamibacterales bacterium]
MRTRLMIAAAGLVLLGTLVVLGGLVPIQASSGHWRLTAWMLDFIKRRSVATYSIFVTEPTDKWPSWVNRGAAHYESGCRACHGSPISPRPPMMMRMTPHPPELPERMARWNDRELFQIVRHGIKFTAMPAWAAPQRPDEVWALVTFLRTLPGLTQERYQQLAFGETSTSDGVSPVERCARCHGIDGLGRAGVFPVLAGQRAEYLDRALRAYRDGRRHSGFMQTEAAELGDTARHAVVNYYAGLPRPSSAGSANGPGAALAASGDPTRQVPACRECHGPSARDSNPAYPILTGQNADFLFEQLVLFSENRRGGSAFAPVMQAIASRLTRDQMRAAADHYGIR